ncbi:YqaE/Pmp3 family membrane protein [Vibrio sp. 1-Bac 57]|uniref:YqaE/Pmp3 family membrane protein n=1 Tax=Psychromonas sp. SA13A TaxID=2686346 RepID=UPI00140AE856|nr:YqaE/Pmp3 family membrane protein [Psychromonas sp. SA13A]
MNQLLNIIICILLPPLAVFLKFGLGKDFLINLILSIFFFVPGIIHALWLTTR